MKKMGEEENHRRGSFDKLRTGWGRRRKAEEGSGEYMYGANREDGERKRRGLRKIYTQGK
jgi:hypothetical protein